MTQLDRNSRSSTASVNLVSPDATARKGPIAGAGRYCSTQTLSQNYTLESKVLGTGMNGPVQLATNKVSKTRCAVKSYKKLTLSEIRLRELKSEVEVYLSLDHPHIARLDMVYETEDEMHLVMEYMSGGELYDRLSKKKLYSEQDAAETANQMFLAVAYLHSHGIVHRDLKLENYLYESEKTDQLKLIDFGFAKFWRQEGSMTQACGSLHYVAPEVLAKNYTNTADLWSLGVIVYMLLTGSPPFYGKDAEIVKRIKRGDVQWSTKFYRLSERARDFVSHLLKLKPSQRLTAQQALEHPFIADRSKAQKDTIDVGILSNLRSFANAAHFRRVVLSMMAWSLSTEDQMKLRDRFLEMDVEKTGTLTHAQFKAVFENEFHITNDEIEVLFKSLDTDNDNEIAYSEFLAAAMRDRVKVHEDVLRLTFAKFDRSRSGRISEDDLRSILGTEFEGETMEHLIQEADADADGFIDYEEFLHYICNGNAKNTSNDEAARNQSDPICPKKAERAKIFSKLVDRLLAPQHTEEKQQVETNATSQKLLFSALLLPKMQEEAYPEKSMETQGEIQVADPKVVAQPAKKKSTSCFDFVRLPRPSINLDSKKSDTGARSPESCTKLEKSEFSTIKTN